MADDLPLVLFVPDLAKALRCSTRTVERLHRAGRLPHPLPIPGRPRWARETILVWLTGRGGRR